MLHFPGKKDALFVVICPGGGYEVVCSMFEGFPVAAALNRMGYHAFAVQYRYGRNALRPATRTTWPRRCGTSWTTRRP